MSQENQHQVTAESKEPGELLTRAQIEREFGLRTSYLEKLAHTGGGPCYLKLGRRIVRYRRSDLEQWLDAHKVRNTSDTLQAENAHQDEIIKGVEA